ATINIDEVRPSWHGVKLTGVDVSVADLSSTVVRFETIDIDFGWSGKKVALQNGSVSAVGSRDVVMREVEQWQSHYLRAAVPKGDASSSSRQEREHVVLPFV